MASRGLAIQLVTTTYHPDPTGIGVYATEIAEHLAAAGHDVRVLATMPHYPQWRIRPEYRGKRRVVEERNDVKIERLWLYVPRSQSLAKRALYEGSFLVHGLLGHRSARKLDLIISLIPNVANGAIGLVLAKRAGAALMLCVQDLSGTGAHESAIPGGRSVASLVSKAEAAIAKRAAMVTVCSEGFARTLTLNGVPADRIVPLPNWSRLPAPARDRSTVRERHGWLPHERIVLHAGNMGLKQQMDLVGDYAREACVQAPDLRFVLVGDGSQRQAVEHATMGMANVTVMSPVPEPDLSDLLAAADVLFLHERPGLKEMSVPSKLTAYFAVGRPVVAAVESGGPAAELVRAAGAGVVTPAGDPTGVVNVLAKLVADHDRCRQLGESGRRFAERELTQDAAIASIDRIVDAAVRRVRVGA